MVERSMKSRKWCGKRRGSEREIVAEKSQSLVFSSVFMLQFFETIKKNKINCLQIAENLIIWRLKKWRKKPMVAHLMPSHPSRKPGLFKSFCSRNGIFSGIRNPFLPTNNIFFINIKK